MFARHCFCVRNRSQPFASVCKCPQPFASDRRRGNMAVPMTSSAKEVTFNLEVSNVA